MGAFESIVFSFGAARVFILESLGSTFPPGYNGIEWSMHYVSLLIFSFLLLVLLFSP